MSERNGGWCFTPHAIERMEEMGLTRVDVLPVVMDAEVSWTGGGRTVFQRDRLAVVTSEDRAIITVLWRRLDQWARSQPPLSLSHP